MIINIHAGHGYPGKGAAGAVGVLNESLECRKIRDKVIAWLMDAGHTVYDCTVDEGSAGQILSGIVKKCNAHRADLDVSLHMNAGASRPYCDGVTTGVEAYCYNPQTTAAVNAANRILSSLAGIGFKNRGLKFRRDLYVLANTVAPALLLEICFVDDGDDAALYNANIERVAKTIAEGIAGQELVPKEKAPDNVEGGIYRLYNANTGDHFYTKSPVERDSLINAGWGYEGVSWLVPEEGGPVYRAYNPNSGRHMFTSLYAEYESLDKAGWTPEGIAWYSDHDRRTPVHRLYNPNSGEHFYTASSIEKANLKALGWDDEGIEFYGK